MKYKLSFLLVPYALCLFTSCHIYSFTGASIAPNIKTVSISYFTNTAALINPSISPVFTEKLKDRFINTTNLALVERNGDLRFEGSITKYFTAPQAIQANATAALNRLTIEVSVKFTNTKDEKLSYETTFSRYEDYPSNLPLAGANETKYIGDICDQLVDDIFNKAVVNW